MVECKLLLVTLFGRGVPASHASRVVDQHIQSILVFTREDFTALVLANWGPISLSYEIKGVPYLKNKRFEVVVQKVRWGHLPLPDPAAAWVSSRVAGMFLRMEKELAILNSLGRCDLGNGRVYVATRGS